MVCDTRLKKGQTIQARADEVRRASQNFVAGLLSGKVKVVIGPQGAISFTGLSEQERDGITDNCAYRRIVASGSVAAMQAITRAEMMSGRKINKQAISQGYHTHDGQNWHKHK